MPVAVPARAGEAFPEADREEGANHPYTPDREPHTLQYGTAGFFPVSFWKSFAEMLCQTLPHPRPRTPTPTPNRVLVPPALPHSALCTKKDGPPRQKGWSTKFLLETMVCNAVGVYQRPIRVRICTPDERCAA